MLKDQLIAFAALLPFLTAPIIAPKPTVDAKTGKPATAVSNEPPLGTNTSSVAAKADDKKPPVKPADPKTEVKKPDPKTETKQPEAKKPDEKSTTGKPVDPKTEGKKTEDKKPLVGETKKPDDKTATGKPVDPKVEVKKPEVKTTTPPVEKPKPDETKPRETKQQGTGELLKVQSLPNFEEITIGTGLKLAPAERAVIHFVVADSSGRELVNSRKRGLPFTIEAKPDGTELWDFLLKDMKVGGCRKITLLPAQVNDGKGLSPYVPAGIQVSVTVWLLRSVR